MLNKLILTSFSFLFSLHSFGQTIIDLGDDIDRIDGRFTTSMVYYVNPDNTRTSYSEYTGYKKLNDKQLRQTALKFDTYYSGVVGEFFLESKIEEFIPDWTYDYALPVDSLREMSVSDWEDLCFNKNLVLKQNENELHTLQMHSAQLLLIVEYQYNPDKETNEELSYHNFTYNEGYADQYSFCYVRVGKNKHVILLFKMRKYATYIAGVIIPYKDHLKINGNLVSYEEVNYKVTFPLPYICPPHYFDDIVCENFYKVANLTNGKAQLTDFFGTPLPLIADSILLKPNHIITYNNKKRRYTIYDKHINKIPVKNVHSILSDNMQIRVGRKNRWIVDNKILNKPPGRKL